MLRGLLSVSSQATGDNLGENLRTKLGLEWRPRCQGVEVFRQNHPAYDDKDNLNELADQMKQVHWTLFLEYNPGQTIHNWTLFPWTGGNEFGGELVKGGMVSGEGSVSRIADQICIVCYEARRKHPSGHHSNLANNLCLAVVADGGGHIRA